MVFTVIGELVVYQVRYNLESAQYLRENYYIMILNIYIFNNMDVIKYI